MNNFIYIIVELSLSSIETANYPCLMPVVVPTVPATIKALYTKVLFL